MRTLIPPSRPGRSRGCHLTRQGHVALAVATMRAAALAAPILWRAGGVYRLTEKGSLATGRGSTMGEQRW